LIKVPCIRKTASGAVVLIFAPPVPVVLGAFTLLKSELATPLIEKLVGPPVPGTSKQMTEPLGILDIT
jgi:hypothetical protein